MAEADRIKTYLTLFKHSSLDVDWKAFATEVGIASVGNAQRKFKTYLKADGYQLANGKIGPIDEKDITETPVKAKKSTISKQTTPKKRKVTEEIENSDDDSS